MEFERLQEKMGDKQVIVGHIEKKEELQEEEVMEGAQAEKKQQSKMTLQLRRRIHQGATKM